MWRADPLQLAVPQAWSHTSLHSSHRTGVDGTSTRRHGQQRTGDGGSPVARSPANITPESLEETRPTSTNGPGSRTGSGGPTGSPTEWAGEQEAGQGGWYRGVREHLVPSKEAMSSTDEGPLP
jgi:hypothetical protein